MTLQPPEGHEDIVVQLPLSVDASTAVMFGVADRYPNAVAVTEHPYGTDKLVIRVAKDDYIEEVLDEHDGP